MNDLYELAADIYATLIRTQREKGSFPPTDAARVAVEAINYAKVFMQEWEKHSN
jgi:hypothetical protein